MIKIILYLFIVILGYNFAQDVCHIQGSCQEGYNLNFTSTDTYLDCQEVCQNYDGCNYFTHEQTGDLCQLLSNCTEVVSSLCPTCYTGEPDCQQVICSQPGTCQGEMVGEYYTDNEKQCLEKCQDLVDCSWYTYSESFRFCLLTSDCDPEVSSISVYGQRECYYAFNGTDSSRKKII